MKTYISSLNYMDEEMVESYLNRLENEFKNMNDLNVLATDYMKEKISKDYEKFWLWLKQHKNMSADCCKCYYKLSPIFGNESIELLLSKEINEKIFNSGLMDGQLYTITAPSGKGKTSFCIMLITYLILGFNPFIKKSNNKKRYKILYISLEQSREEIEARLISTISAFKNIESTISFSELLSGKCEDQKKYFQAIEYFILFYDSFKILTVEDFGNKLDLESINSTIESLGFEYDVIVIDQYDNIEGVDLFNSNVPIGIKAMAQNMHVPIILQAQLNKSSIANAITANGKIDSKKITGNSLKGTSALEHQSSMVLTLIPQTEVKTIYGHHAIKMTCQTVKNRYGKNESINLWFLGAVNIFLDYCQQNYDEDKNYQEGIEEL